MNIIQSFKIPARLCGQNIEIELSNWSYLANGQGHIILHNNNQKDKLYDKVIIICIHVVNSFPKQIQKLYFQIITSLPNIKLHLLKRDILQLREKEKQQLKKYVTIQLKVPKQIPEDFIVHVANNLSRNKQKWQYYLQFKPKTALPEVYSQKMLESISIKYGIKLQQIQSALSNRSILEKTRWFTKNSLKVNKKNMNPLEIYGIETQKQPRLIDQLKIVASNRELIPKEKETLNSNIIKRLRQSLILNDITLLQLLFVGSSDIFEKPISQVWDMQQNKQTTLKKIHEKILSSLRDETSASQKLTNLLHNIDKQKPKTFQSQQDQLEFMLRFLISWSWRDTSLFINIKLSDKNQEIEDIQFTIIDYQIKQSQKVLTTRQNDEQYLVNYLKYLKII